VITQKQEETDDHGRLLEAWFPQFKVQSWCISDQPEGVHDEETKALAIPKIVALAHEIADRNVDGLIISCADDPGVAEVRQMLSIPVVGAGESTAAAATRYGNRVFTLGITDRVPAAYPRILGDKFAGNVVPEGVTNTLDLRTENGRTQTIAAAHSLRNQGADAIALACTGLATIGIAALLEREAGIPVLDPVMCEGHALLLDLLRTTEYPKGTK
ncbi:MAG: aspartate/glutamate racemase family protein, partial [Raoultibacter sp.]